MKSSLKSTLPLLVLCLLAQLPLLPPGQPAHIRTAPASDFAAPLGQAPAFSAPQAACTNLRTGFQSCAAIVDAQSNLAPETHDELLSHADSLLLPGRRTQEPPDRAPPSLILSC